MTDAMTNHSDMESLAAFVDGRLEREERDAVVKHLETCEECQGFVREAAAFEQEEEAAEAAPKPRRTWWSVAAAAVVVVLAVAPFIRGFLQRRESEKHAQKVFAAMLETGTRTMATRFSGQNTYAPWKVMRSEPKGKNLFLQGAAADLAITTEEDDSPTGRRRAALAESILGDKKKALAILTGIPEKSRDAAIWNDIAGYQHHLGGDQAALAAINEALRLDPKMPEALFNRAAILQQRDDRGAAAAWQEYFAVEPTGQWAEEARKKIYDLSRPQ
jgi:tetratricopeptide (TPR) repeat protein